ncbi:MAG: o-succinylbenzoate synthase [Candidatus Nanopelagicales bacterium]|jgi:o-succinylbenzoate synthase|nr:o-succinylbenzoate synthase [Candidatus Nanopelagicales bacterium]
MTRTADARLLADVLASAIPFRLALTGTFRGLQHREGVLFEGPSGWGEFAPFDDYSDERAARWLASALEASYGTWPAALRDDVPVNAIIGQVDAQHTHELAVAAVRDLGCHTIKIKVGADLSSNEACIAAVRGVLDEELGVGVGKIRIDVNAGWSVSQAIEQLRTLAQFGIEYVEQPCATIAELRELRSQIDVPIAADESIRLADDPSRIAVAECADVAVLKPTTLGGVERTLAIAEKLNVPVVISGSLDSSVGLGVGLATAAALPELPFACGLGTGTLFAQDVVAHSVVPAKGRITSARISTDRINPDRMNLDAAAARISPMRAAWWQDRLTAAWTHLP